MRSAPVSPAQAAKQTANQAPQAPQDKTVVPADTEAGPQSAAQAETQRPVPGGSYEFHTDPWATLYAKGIDDMIAALKSKGVRGQRPTRRYRRARDQPLLSRSAFATFAFHPRVSDVE